MSKPAVTVIVPTYNRAALLAQALDSVAAQTFTEFEVVVVDDGSTEPIEEMVAGHATRPRFIRQANLGPAAARNRGIESAAAPLVAFLDSDDLWLPQKLETCARYFESHRDIRIVFGPMSPIDAAGAPVPGRTKPCHGGWITEHLFRSSFVHVPTVVAHRDLLRDAGGFNETLPVCEDYDLWLRLSVDNPFGLVEPPLALRRLHDNRLSKSRMSRNLAVKARMLRDFFESGRARGKLRHEIARPRLAKVCLSAGRAAFAGGEYRSAVDHFRLARADGGSFFRIASWQVIANALAIFERQVNTEPASSPAPVSQT